MAHSLEMGDDAGGEGTRTQPRLRHNHPREANPDVRGLGGLHMNVTELANSLMTQSMDVALANEVYEIIRIRTGNAAEGSATCVLALALLTKAAVKDSRFDSDVETHL